MAWCFSTRASVATVLTTHPCVSRCLRVNWSYSIIHSLNRCHDQYSPYINEKVMIRKNVFCVYDCGNNVHYVSYGHTFILWLRHVNTSVTHLSYNSAYRNDFNTRHTMINGTNVYNVCSKGVRKGVYLGLCIQNVHYAVSVRISECGCSCGCLSWSSVMQEYNQVKTMLCSTNGVYHLGGHYLVPQISP